MKDKGVCGSGENSRSFQAQSTDLEPPPSGGVEFPGDLASKRQTTGKPSEKRSRGAARCTPRRGADVADVASISNARSPSPPAQNLTSNMRPHRAIRRDIDRAGTASGGRDTDLARGKLLALPAYRQRKGYDQAIVTLTDSVSGKRRDYWLGTFDSSESRERYLRLLAEWETNGRRWPERKEVASVAEAGRPTAGLTVAELISQYWAWAKTYYTHSASCSIRSALRVLRSHYGTADAGSFGPNALRIVRDSMVLGKAEGKRRRPPWCRKTVNGRIGDIVRMFRWAASRELVSAQVYQSLQTLPALKRGRCAAADHDAVKPVPMDLIEAVKPHVSRQVAALIDLQLLTGARPGELLQLRACDLDTSGSGDAHTLAGRMRGSTVFSLNAKREAAGKDGEEGRIWAYRPSHHKNQHRGKDRTIYFGPQAQLILRQFMADRPLDGYLFSPAEADLERKARRNAARKTPLSCGNVAGGVTTDDPQWQAGEHYTTASYRRAIERGCDKAFPPPGALQPRRIKAGPKESDLQLHARLTPQQRRDLEEWRAEHRWHPNQLRHTAATLIRKQFGLEAAQLVLGHSSAMITDAVYAERDAGQSRCRPN